MKRIMYITALIALTGCDPSRVSIGGSGTNVGNGTARLETLCLIAEGDFVSSSQTLSLNRYEIQIDGFGYGLNYHVSGTISCASLSATSPLFNIPYLISGLIGEGFVNVSTTLFNNNDHVFVQGLTWADDEDGGTTARMHGYALSYNAGLNTPGHHVYDREGTAQANFADYLLRIRFRGTVPEDMRDVLPFILAPNNEYLDTSPGNGLSGTPNTAMDGANGFSGVTQ